MFLTLSQWEFKPSGSGYRIKKVLHGRLFCVTRYIMTNVWGEIRSTAPSRTNTAIRFKGYSSDSGTRSLLQHSPRRGGSSSCMTFSLKGLVTFGELVPSQLPLFAGSHNSIPIHRMLGYFGTRRTKRSIFLGGGQAKMAQRLVDRFGNVSHVDNRLNVVFHRTGCSLGERQPRSMAHLEVDTGSGRRSLEGVGC